MTQLYLSLITAQKMVSASQKFMHISVYYKILHNSYIIELTRCLLTENG